MPRLPGFTEHELREAVANSYSFTGTLRWLRMRTAGGNHRTIKKYVRVWDIDTSHFDPNAGRHSGPRVPLEEILVEHSTFSRGHLKKRLYKAGIKRPICELCGQGETWCGKRMALILDHINGIATDNRLSNLRIICPNCAATLDTHCGRNLARERSCEHCQGVFHPRRRSQRYCSLACWGRSAEHRRNMSKPRPERRKVSRPPYDQLVAEVRELGYLGVGRKYGVSDNAIRKWIRWYERDRAVAEAQLAAEQLRLVA